MPQIAVLFPGGRIAELTRNAQPAAMCALPAGWARVSSRARRAFAPQHERTRQMATTTTPQDVEATVVENLVAFGADADAVSRDATLASIDVDSPDLVELTQVVEETYDIDLDGADFKNIRTVGDVVDLVLARVEG